MYDGLIVQIRQLQHWFKPNGSDQFDPYVTLGEAADAIEELQATLCNWCAVCPEDKRDLSTCEIYESCRAKKPPEEE